MPEFLEDPSVLTKEKLKSELVANNVMLPAGEQRKDVYVQLYLQHLTARNRPPAAARRRRQQQGAPGLFQRRGARAHPGPRTRRRCRGPQPGLRRQESHKENW